MNLYIFNETRHGALYGVGTYIRELAASLKNSEINVCVIHLFSDRHRICSEEKDGIRYWFFPAPVSEQQNKQEQWELYHRNVVYLLRLHINDKKNLIFHLNYHQKGQLAEELKIVFDCRIVVTVHYLNWCLRLTGNVSLFRKILTSEVNGQLDDMNGMIYESYQLEKTLFNAADQIICLSNYMYEILYHDYGLDVSKLSVISNGLTDMAKTTYSNNQLRKKWKISNEEKIILFVGRVEENKGLNYLINAFRKVLPVYPESRLIIAGAGEFNKFIIQSQDICTKVTFTGFLEKYKLNEIYQIADVGIMPSFFETFGYVAVEMMMHELPFVATSTSGLNEVIDETTGLKIPVIEYPDSVEMDADLMAEKIIYLLEHPEEAKRMGKNARKRYEERYSIELFRENMLNFYGSLLQINNQKNE